MRKVIVESPFAGAVNKNIRYLRACMHDAFTRGEYPFASHGLYTQPGVLDDGNPADRELGIQAGFAWRSAAQASVFYIDLGMSDGMEYGLKAAQKCQVDNPGHVIEYRYLGPGWEASALKRESSFITKWPDAL